MKTKRFRFLLATCAFICAFSGLGNALADTITIPSVADTELEQLHPDLNLGTDASLVAGELGSSARFEIRRGLFQFNLTNPTNQIPPGSVINSVTLRIVAVLRVPISPANSIFDLRRLLVPWSESQATWNSRLAGTPWEMPGAIGAEHSVAHASF